MESQALNNTSAKDSPGNVSDVDRELEAYLEEKRGKGDGTVDSQLADLRYTQGKSQQKRPDTDTQTAEGSQPQQSEKNNKSNKSDNNSHQRTTPSSDTRSAEQQKEDTNTTPTQRINKDDSHESIIRALEKKYAAGSQQEAPSASQQTSKQRSEPSRSDAPQHKAERQADRPKQESTPGKSTETSPQQEASSSWGTSSEALTRIMEALVEPSDEYLRNIKTEFKKLSPEAAEDVVAEFEPKFVRNKERKELFERTKRDLEGSLLKRLQEAGEKNTHDATTDTHNEAPASPTQEGGNTQPEASSEKPAQPEESQAITGTKDESKKENQTPKPASPEKRADAAKQYAREHDLLTMLSYDPEKGFVRTSAFESSDVTISVESGESDDVVRVVANNAQGETVASAEIAHADLD